MESNDTLDRWELGLIARMNELSKHRDYALIDLSDRT
jgi:hypothetical protein